MEHIWVLLVNLYKGRINRRVNLAGSLFLTGFYLLYRVIFGTDIEVNSITGLILNFCIIWFGFSLYVRRLHDLGRSGWWTLIIFIPIVDAIFLLYLSFAPGQFTPNLYGDVPPKDIKIVDDLLNARLRNVKRREVS